MSEILFISKPIAPPWNDSGKNLVRDLARSLRGHRAHILTHVNAGLAWPEVELETIYEPGREKFAPALLENARVFRRLMLGPKLDFWHFFFAPNLKTSTVGRASTMFRGVKSVHTIASAPAANDDLQKILFADIHVVLSEHTEHRFLSAGVARDRVVRIAPCVPALDKKSLILPDDLKRRLGLRTDAALVVFPGDLEFGGAAELVLETAKRANRSDIQWVFACRTKTARAKAVETKLREEVLRLGLKSQVGWVGETREIHSLLNAASVVILPATSLYAKMDYPLVLLEAMQLEKPIVVARGTPACEFALEGGTAVEAHADSLARDVVRFVDDAELCAKTGANGAAYVAKNFSPRVMADAYARVYDKLK